MNDGSLKRINGTLNAKPLRKFLRPAMPLLFVAMIAAAISGCGFIADKDRIVVATLDGEAIRRGDLAAVIREMPDEERPLIQNKGDLLRTLNKYINDRIKTNLAKQLKAEGKIQVDRQVARDAYFKKHPESRSVEKIRTPEALQMTQGDVNAMLAENEFGVDEEEEILLREEALNYKIQEAVQIGAISVTEDEFSREYNMLRDILLKFEYVEFDAIQFPIKAPGAVEAAAEARKRLNRGETFDVVSETYSKLNPAMVFGSAMENNPASTKYREFWDAVSDCKVGQHFGPVFMPEREQFGRAEDGTSIVQTIPAVYLVLEVVGHEPAREMTPAEARPALTLSILQREVMELLRKEHGVEIYSENLWRPEGYGDQYKDQMIKTGV